MVHLIKIALKIFLGFTLALGMQNTFAEPAQPDLTCPSGAILKNATPLLRLPYTYLKTSQEMGYFSLNILFSPVQLKIKNTLEQLTATSEKPLEYQAPYINGSNEIEDNEVPVEFLKFCFYEVAGNSNIDATAVYLDLEDEVGDGLPNIESFKHKFKQNEKFHQKIMMLASAMQAAK
jgi:hypothetical protein